MPCQRKRNVGGCHTALGHCSQLMTRGSSMSLPNHKGSREVWFIRYPEEEVNWVSMSSSKDYHILIIIKWPTRESINRFFIHPINIWVLSSSSPSSFLSFLLLPLLPLPLPLLLLLLLSSFFLSFSSNNEVIITYLVWTVVTSGGKMLKTIAVPSALIEFIVKWKSQIMKQANNC